MILSPRQVESKNPLESSLVRSISPVLKDSLQQFKSNSNLSEEMLSQLLRFTTTMIVHIVDQVEDANTWFDVAVGLYYSHFAINDSASSPLIIGAKEPGVLCSSRQFSFIGKQLEPDSSSLLCTIRLELLKIIYLLLADRTVDKIGRQIQGLEIAKSLFPSVASLKTDPIFPKLAAGIIYLTLPRCVSSVSLSPMMARKDAQNLDTLVGVFHSIASLCTSEMVRQEHDYSSSSVFDLTTLGGLGSSQHRRNVENTGSPLSSYFASLNSILESLSDICMAKDIELSVAGHRAVGDIVRLLCAGPFRDYQRILLSQPGYPSCALMGYSSLTWESSCTTSCWIRALHFITVLITRGFVDPQNEVTSSIFDGVGSFLHRYIRLILLPLSSNNHGEQLMRSFPSSSRHTIQQLVLAKSSLMLLIAANAREHTRWILLSKNARWHGFSEEVWTNRAKLSL